MSRGGRPILVTPPVRQLFGTDGTLNNTARHINSLGVDLPAEMRSLAAERDLSLIDLTDRSRQLVESLGPTASSALYLPEKKNRTHTSEHGADQMAQLVLGGIGRGVDRFAQLPPLTDLPAATAGTAAAVPPRTSGLAHLPSEVSTTRWGRSPGCWLRSRGLSTPTPPVCCFVTTGRTSRSCSPPPAIGRRSWSSTVAQRTGSLHRCQRLRQSDLRLRHGRYRCDLAGSGRDLRHQLIHRGARHATAMARPGPRCRRAVLR